MTNLGELKDGMTSLAAFQQERRALNTDSFLQDVSNVNISEISTHCSESMSNRGSKELAQS